MSIIREENYLKKFGLPNLCCWLSSVVVVVCERENKPLVSGGISWVMIKIPQNLSGLKQLGLFLTHAVYVCLPTPGARVMKQPPSEALPVTM